MRKVTRTVAVVLAAAFIGGSMSSCIGSFGLTNKLLTWNRNIDSKFVNELVFIAFWILPVYEVSGLADLLVINSIEFWSGSNPVVAETKTVEGSDGQRYLVESDSEGYTITSETTGETTRLTFSSDERAWDVTTAGGETYRLMTFVDDSHVRMPGANGREVIIEISAEGLMAYRAAAVTTQMAQR